MSAGTVKNSSQGTADYTITVDFENDIGMHLVRSSTNVNGVRSDQQLPWTVTAHPRSVRADEPYSLTVVGCSVTVTKVVDGQQEFAMATPEYAGEANRLCSDLQRQLDAVALTPDDRLDDRKAWAHLKTHAELSRPTVDRLRRLPPIEQALELLEALDDWEQFLDQEEELSLKDVSSSEKAREWDLIPQPGFDAAGALAGYGLTACAETLPYGA